MQQTRSVGRLASLFAAPSSSWASADIREYRAGYPNQKQGNGTKNLDFYLNRAPCAPSPCGLIDDVHQRWRGDYDLLERHHGYIQWFFPIRENGMNMHSQMLYIKERDALRSNAQAQRRLITSYEIMLDFYGMQLADENLGFVVRAANYAERYDHLNHSGHNYLRITRILKCLGELGREELKLGLLLHFVQELVGGKLSARTVGKSAVGYFFPTLCIASDRERLQRVIDDLVSAEANSDAVVELPDERIRRVLEEASQDRLQTKQAKVASFVAAASTSQPSTGSSNSDAADSDADGVVVDATVAAGASAAAAAAPKRKQQYAQLDESARARKASPASADKNSATDEAP